MSVQEVYSRMPKGSFTPPIGKEGGFALHFIDEDGRIIGNPIKVSRIYEYPEGTHSVYYPPKGEKPNDTLLKLMNANNTNSLIKVTTKKDGPLALTQRAFAEMKGIPMPKQPRNIYQPIVSPAAMQRLQNLKNLKNDEFQRAETLLPPTDSQYNPPPLKELSVFVKQSKVGKTSPKNSWINKLA